MTWTAGAPPRRSTPSPGRLPRSGRSCRTACSATPPQTAMRANRELAVRAADSVDALRANVTEWFNHYNLYDPLFTWWVPVPYGHADKALVDYAAFLRGPVADAGHQTTNAAPVGGPIAAAPAPKLPSVPDLAAIIALPQDEMTPVVQRFLGRAGRRTRRRRRGPCTRVLQGLAGGAQDTGLRRSEPQRAGRLPVHQAHARSWRSRAPARFRRRTSRARPTTAASPARRAAATD